MITHPQTQREIDRFLSKPVHAVGLSGIDGVGKGYVARHIAAKLLDMENTNAQHPYLITLDVMQDKIGIEQIRELQATISLTVPGQSEIRRVVIIEHFDNLGLPAQNALLKTLEEPPAGTLILLTFSKQKEVLDTIHSRILQISIRQVSLAELLKSTDGNKTDIERAAHLSNGAVGLFMALVRQEKDHPLVSAVHTAKELMGLSRYQRLARVDEVIKGKTDTRLILDGLHRILHTMAQQAITKDDRKQITSLFRYEKLVYSAIKDIEAGVSAKLVVTRLFFEM